MMRRDGLQKGNSGKKATKEFCENNGRKRLLDGCPHQDIEVEQGENIKLVCEKVNYKILVQITWFGAKFNVAMNINRKGVIHRNG